MWFEIYKYMFDSFPQSDNKTMLYCSTFYWKTDDILSQISHRPCYVMGDYVVADMSVTTPKNIFQ